MEHARGSNIFFLNLKCTLQKFDQKPKNPAALTDDFTILPPMNPLQSHGLVTKFGLVLDPFSLVPLLKLYWVGMEFYQIPGDLWFSRRWCGALVLKARWTWIKHGSLFSCYNMADG